MRRSLLLALALAAAGPALPVSAQVDVGEAAEAPGDSDEALLDEGRAVPGKATRTKVSGGAGEPVVAERVRVSMPGDEPDVVYTFTERGATVLSAELQAERYRREAFPPVPGVPERILEAGPIDLVTTWSPRFLPFRATFNEFEVPGEATVVLRKADGGVIRGGRLGAPDDRDALEVDRQVDPGDTVEIEAPSRAAGTYEIDRVTVTGAVELSPPPEDADDVSYRVVRRGSLKDLYDAGPTFHRVTEQAGLPLVYVWPDPRTDESDVFIEKRFAPGDNPHALKLTVTIHNFGDDEVRQQMGLRVTAWQHPEMVSGSLFSFPTHMFGAGCYTGGSLERVDFPDLVEEAETFRTGARWVGVDTRYFLMAAVQENLEGAQCHLQASPLPPDGIGVLTSTLWAPAVQKLEPGTGACVPDWLSHREGVTTCREAAEALGHDLSDSLKEIRATWQSDRLDVEGAARQRLDDAWTSLRSRRRAIHRFTLFTGPKSDDLLRDTGYELSAAHDFGILSVIAEPLHLLLTWFHGITGHWALAIILLTVLLKLALLPLTNKSFKNMQKMAKLRPDMQKIQEEFKDDREGAGRAQMALFKREKVNPLSGCLPMLVQMPIWFALYRTILKSVELYHAELGGWIHDLSSPDPYFILPVVLGILMLVQSFVTPTAAGTEGGQAKFLKYGMPVMFSVFMVALPSGLVLYILVNTVLTIFQNLIIRRRMA
ncbi:MAG: YidC/Oxa1 family insertase periplasmic-domain containing protein [Myxococcota bacterium]